MMRGIAWRRRSAQAGNRGVGIGQASWVYGDLKGLIALVIALQVGPSALVAGSFGTDSASFDGHAPRLAGPTTFAPLLSGLQAFRFGRKRYREQRQLDFRSLARVSCSGPRCSRRRSGVQFWRNGFGDDQPPATAGAWQREDAGGCIGVTGRAVVPEIRIWLSVPEQFPDPGDIGRTVAIPEEAVVADAMLPLGQDMDQEAPNERAGLQGHGGMPPGTVDAVILDLECHAVCIEPDQSAV